ncbi:MAG: hypothetical protein H0W08_25585, partial [Acidobacteria bacterium]|nr:hypothetical protein [Acidobacteriota bacterium]
PRRRARLRGRVAQGVARGLAQVLKWRLAQVVRWGLAQVVRRRARRWREQGIGWRLTEACLRGRASEGRVKRRWCPQVVFRRFAQILRRRPHILRRPFTDIVRRWFAQDECWFAQDERGPRPPEPGRWLAEVVRRLAQDGQQPQAPLKVARGRHLT